MPFQFRYQQYISNFIRTGDPNSMAHFYTEKLIIDYTGNPVDDAQNGHVNWELWSENHHWLDVGKNANKEFEMQTEDPREAACALWDALDLFMTI